MATHPHLPSPPRGPRAAARCLASSDAPRRTKTWACNDRTAAVIRTPARISPASAIAPAAWTSASPWWISTARLLRDAITLAGMLPDTCAGIVGIPRSGLIPASVIATSLHLPLWSIEGRTLRPCQVPASRGGGLPARGGPLAVVDDTTFTGDAMRRVRAALGSRPAVYCAVYVNSLRPASRAAVDLFAVEPAAAPARMGTEQQRADGGTVSTPGLR